MSFLSSYNKEQRIFLEIKDILENRLSCKILPIQKDHVLDINSGIDYFIKKNKDVFGLSSRINFYKPNYNHVTIRYKRKNGSSTEYEKRIKCIEDNNDQIKPKYQIQIDFDYKNNKLIDFILFNTETFYSKLKENVNNVKKETCNEGNEYLKINLEFFVKNKIPFTRLKDQFLN